MDEILMFSDKQLTALQSPLSRQDVDQRDGPGKQRLDYVSGNDHVVRVANQIFGFDGWERETLEMLETATVKVPPSEKNPSVTFVSHYRARVRITVWTADRTRKVVREGWGGCKMQSATIGDAVENAMKGAETDAMKRAFVTFGDQFGLALYDKKREHVTDAPPQQTRGIMSSFTALRKPQQEPPPHHHITGEVIQADAPDDDMPERTTAATLVRVRR